MPLSTPVPSLLRWFSAFLVALCVTSPLTGRNNSIDNRFETLAKSATTAREAGKKDEAIANYHRALDVNPEWEEGWWYMGTMLYGGGRSRP